MSAQELTTVIGLEPATDFSVPIADISLLRSCTAGIWVALPFRLPTQTPSEAAPDGSERDLVSQSL